MMKTVYEHFLSYADTLLSEKDSICKDRVRSGIRSFLSKMELPECPDPEGRIASRELLRFRSMPADTFAAFFENYEIRSDIQQFRNTCMGLAMERIQRGNLISSREKAKKLSEFYGLAADLAADKRYTSWLDDIAVLVKIDLAFAAGQSDAVSKELAEWLAQQH